MAGDVVFRSYSKRTGEKNKMDWFEWCVYAAGPPEVVDEIDEVWYVLHPTFPDPERTVRDRSNLFALYSAGWGSFGIEIKVVFKDGTATLQDYFLDLRADDWPTKVLDTPVDETTRHVYDSLFHEKHRWRKESTIAKTVGLGIDETQAVLDRLESENYVRRAYFTSPDGETLWGATAIVGVSPQLE